MTAADTPQIRLYNTATRQKEAFTPLDPQDVRMYVCGPTVYDYAHIGNARPVIVFDVLYRLLRHVYGRDHVTYVRNITDVEDKIIARSAERGISIGELTEATTKQFQADMAALGCLPPDAEPRATAHIDGMIGIIERLIVRGHAYVADGHVLFEVATWPQYGRLANRSPEEMRAGARVEVAPYKRDPMDFVLWKPSTDDQPGWPSPWGRGRPGWHIECSAMSEAELGTTFDIHGGGIDLVFPHHQNEIAQSVCSHDIRPAFDAREDFAQVWMHNGFLQVEGQKMSKSLGNFLVVHDLLQDWPGEVLRLQMLMTHYRQPLDWTERRCREARDVLDRWYRLTAEVEAADALPDGVVAALSDDLNTAQVIAELHKASPDARALKAAATFLGFLQADPAAWFGTSADAPIPEGEIAARIDARLAARAAKNYAEADRIRDELAAMGIVLKDTKDGTTWELAR